MESENGVWDLRICILSSALDDTYVDLGLTARPIMAFESDKHGLESRFYYVFAS